MPAIVLRQAEHANLQNLHVQLMSGGILQRELWEEAEEYLINKGIYDVTLIEESNFQEYRKILNKKGYARQQAIQRTAALRKIQKYWVEKEFGDLLTEIDGCNVPEPKLKGNIKRFLIRQGIHHIREVDYLARERYEMELLETRNYAQALKYLNVFDHIKQHDIQKEMESLSGMARNRMQYKNQILFLPYLPDQKLARDFEYIQDKQELVWDFMRTAPELLKHQVFYLLTYTLEHLYRDNPKERRVRYLLPLHWLYDFCAEENIPDLECMELNQIQKFEKIVEKKVANVKNAMQIVDNSRRLLFLAALEIHWYANVWYMERFHLAEDRLNPSNPVLRLTFIDVENRKNREILQKYAQYHVGIGNLTIGNIRQQLYEIKRLMQYFDAEESICEVDTKKLDSYFKVLDEKDTKEATFNTRIAHIKKFYEFLKVNGYVKEIPFQDSYYYKKTFPEHHDRTVEERIYMEILSKLYSFPLELRLIFLHLWCTGLRISEVCTLKGAAYSWDGEDAWLKIYQIKMKAEKMIPIPLVLYKIMQTYISKKHIRPKEYIFKAQDGKAYRYGTFVKNFKNQCEKSGIANSEYVFKSHDYRHTLATQFYDHEVSLQTIRDYLGHYSEEMTKQYVDYMPKKVAKANTEFYAKPENNLGSMITVKKRGEKHDKRIYLKELDCYQQATEEQRSKMRVRAERYFNLEGLPSDNIHRLLEEFIFDRGKQLAPSSLSSELLYYNNIRQFLIDKNIQALIPNEEGKILRSLKSWMLENGYALTSKKYRASYDKIGIETPGIVRHMKKILEFAKEDDNRDEQEKDVWDLDNFDFPILKNPIKNAKTLNFRKIMQPDIREEIKKVIFLHLKYKPLGTVQSEMAAINRFTGYTYNAFPELQSLLELERSHIEKYLTYLHTEATERKNYRSDLYALRRTLEDVGNLYDDQHMGELFLSNDFPSTPRYLFKVYSDAEIKRLNKHIFLMDEQICRALVIHQMLGTRISDTLTLKPDCLTIKKERYFIRIDQVKSVTYEKAISNELAQLILKAIEYTKEKYGETKYIFVSKDDPTKPYQYGMIQNQIMTMIRQEDIRDDNGELLRFGTHIFRHCYGKKLTEMHVDDWLIAKLLGHKTTQSVPYYRRIGNKMMADETRNVRIEMDKILLEILEGWDDFEI